eukprot:961751-Prymnesium_polylepis.1
MWPYPAASRAICGSYPRSHLPAIRRAILELSGEVPASYPLSAWIQPYSCIRYYLRGRIT